MSEQPESEEIPNQYVIAELEAALHSKTTELVLANARIRTRNETIQQLRTELTDAHGRAADVLDDRYGPGV